MKRGLIITILWILLMIAALANMAQEVELNKLRQENYRLMKGFENECRKR